MDPIFGFSGDFLRPSARPSVPPRQGLPAAPRWSQTPLRKDDTPSHTPSMTEPYLRAYEPSPLRTPTYDGPEDTVKLQLAMQDTRLRSQEVKLQHQDTQIQILISLLDSVRRTLEEIKTSMRELQSRNSVTHFRKPDENDLLGNLESVVRAMRNSRSCNGEVEELREENAAMRAKLDTIASAMGVPAGELAKSTLSTSNKSSPNVLGKRKRNSGIEASGAAPTRAHDLENGSSSTPIPTPHSSCASDGHCRQSSNSSEKPTPEEQQPNSSRDEIDRPSRNAPSQRIVSESAVHFAPVATSTAWTKMNTRGSEVSSSEEVSGTLQRLPNPPSQDRPSSRASVENDDCQVSTLQAANNQPQPENNKDNTAHEESGQVFPNDAEPSMDLDPSGPSYTQFPVGDSVEFGDDDQPSPFSAQEPNAEQSDSQNPAPLEIFAPGDASCHSAPSKRTRSKTKAGSRRRVTDSTTDIRSVAPEPAVFPRILPRRLAKDVDEFEVSTPAILEEQMQKPKQPREKRGPKGYLQTTKKILNQELKQLGLEEWIGKDKNTPEYKKAVDDARNRQRERTKMAKLASVGLNVGGSTDDEPLSSPVPPGDDPLDQAFREATAALIDVSNQQVIRRPTSEKPASPAKGVKTRRKQREEEIRRRDQLAKEAMERDD